MTIDHSQKNRPVPKTSAALQGIITRLEQLAQRAQDSKKKPAPYLVPGLWQNPLSGGNVENVEPAAFHLARIRDILSRPQKPLPRGRDGGNDWAENAIAYNLLVRYGAAFDHDGDGDITPNPPASGWRETGTFLKAITLLPFIQSLGCNTIHLLPITAIGKDGNKGNMGSAFAIRDPYALDANLAEPALGLGAEAEFSAFVEAAHHLGIRVVLEFVFRTAAKDAVWAKEHPEWFYWIRADVPDRKNGAIPTEETYGAPLFTPEELGAIYAAVGEGRFHELVPPHEGYRHFFTAPPAPDTVRMENGRWIGEAPDARTGAMVPVRIPGAFCDWGPDSTQPPWTDVTYLRLYDHPDFNYIAYNTVRMYASQLAQPENIVQPLWDKILGIIPYWHRRCGIDGVMVDMGHALPHPLKRALIERARAAAPDFSFWEEEFTTSQALRDEGCNVCVGPFMQTVRNPAWMRGWLQWIAENGIPVPFMAMAENHNTPRAVHWPGGVAYAAYAQTIGAFLPAVPYLHNGIELADPAPVNTGFDFTEAETAALPPARLPLFSAAALGWQREKTLIPALRSLHALREEYRDLITFSGPGGLSLFDGGHEQVLAFRRHKPGGETGLLVIGNGDMQEAHPLPALPPRCATVDLLSGKPAPALLAPAQVVVLEIQP